MKRRLAIGAGIVIGAPLLALIALVIKWSIWTTTYTSKSPDGSQEIRVQTRACFGDCIVRVQAIKGMKAVEIANATDCVHSGNASTTWRGSLADVFVYNELCGQIHIRYDFATGRKSSERTFPTF